MSELVIEIDLLDRLGWFIEVYKLLINRIVC